MARFHYEAEGAITPDRFIGALTDFTSRRPDVWPNLSPKLYAVHSLGPTAAEVTEGSDVLGGVWARERYDWSTPGTVRLTLLESPSFHPGTVVEYRVTSHEGGGCRVAVDFHRRARSLKGRLVGAILQLTGRGRFRGDLVETLRRLESAPDPD
jgi:hypothetical protein